MSGAKVTKRLRYIQTRDGDTFYIPARKKYTMACCDCGLVHNMVFVPTPNGRRIGVAVEIDQRRTAGRRRAAKVRNWIRSAAESLKGRR